MNLKFIMKIVIYSRKFNIVSITMNSYTIWERCCATWNAYAA